MNIYTDGGCRNNPGPGGWAYVILEGEVEIKHAGQCKETTNNRMEMTAVIAALLAVREKIPNTGKINIFTDSKYLQLGITKWIRAWQNNGWKTSAKKVVKNSDLWIKLHELSKNFDIEWHWVAGHSGNKYNEMCDSLVQQEIKSMK
jgi:ribonuclease HI